MSSERRYRGRTPAEAMRRAREELGDEARLVAARRITPADQTPMYEIRVTPGPALRGADPAIEELRREIEALRATVGEVGRATVLAPPAPVPSGPAALVAEVRQAADPLASLLRRRGVSEGFARTLASRARDAAGAGEPAEELGRVVARALASRLPAEPFGRRSVVVVGPSGSGKTSTLAKIAAEAVARGERPVLVCADGESLTGEDALAAVATALSLPFETAFVDGRIDDLVERHGPRATYLVDTPGRVPDDPETVAALQALIRPLPDPEVVLVAPASLEEEELRRLAEGFAALGADRMVVTRLDEAARPARLLELSRVAGHEIAWVTFGKSARGAAAAPDDPRVVARLLGTLLAVERTA